MEQCAMSCSKCVCSKYLVPAAYSTQCSIRHNLFLGMKHMSLMLSVLALRADSAVWTGVLLRISPQH